MDQLVTSGRKPSTFNGPLEAGVRAVALLGAAHPTSFDLQRLVALDYLLVHTGDVGGPTSLHPPTPLQSAELLVRRKLVEQGLLLMMTRDLVSRDLSPSGIRYRAGESAAPFLASLRSDYITALKDRANWLIGAVGRLSDDDFRALMRRFFDSWVEEFQTTERSLGADA
jgi:hypothetical protein